MARIVLVEINAIVIIAESGGRFFFVSALLQSEGIKLNPTTTSSKSQTCHPKKKDHGSNSRFCRSREGCRQGCCHRGRLVGPCWSCRQLSNPGLWGFKVQGVVVLTLMISSIVDRMDQGFVHVRDVRRFRILRIFLDCSGLAIDTHVSSIWFSSPCGE